MTDGHVLLVGGTTIGSVGLADGSAQPLETSTSLYTNPALLTNGRVGLPVGKTAIGIGSTTGNTSIGASTTVGIVFASASTTTGKTQVAASTTIGKTFLAED